MDTDERIAHYRQTNVSYAILESLERARGALLALRYDRIAARQKSFGQRVIGVALSVVAIVPAIYSLLPESYGDIKIVWLGGVVVLAAVYIVTTLHQWRADRKEAAELSALLPRIELDPEHRPEFVSMLLSSYRTRWQMAQAISSDSSNRNTREQFLEIVRFWEGRMRSMIPRFDALRAKGELSEDEYRTLVKWVPTTIDSENIEGRPDG